jgi:hypothetical protein
MDFFENIPSSSRSLIYDSCTPTHEIASLLFFPILSILSNSINMFILSLVYSIHYAYYKSIVKFVYFVYCVLFLCVFLWVFCFWYVSWLFVIVCPWSIVPRNLFWKNIYQSWRWTQLQPWIKNHFQGRS